MGMLLAEQHAGQALAVADPTCVLDRGRVVLERSSAELVHDPGALERIYFR
jgi:ABC-type branched-subunit amino acid transport system ATPase component